MNKEKSAPMLFRCEMCNRSFEQRQGLEQHVKSKDHGFPCEKCSRVFLSSTSLSQHTNSKHRIWDCEYCEMQFERSRAYQQHLFSVHLKFRCKRCRSGFLTKKELDRHHLDKHVPKCEFCGISLKESKKVLHLKDEHNVCPCGANFDDKKSLYLHIDEVHSTVKAYTLPDPEPKKIKKKISLEPDYSL